MAYKVVNGAARSAYAFKITYSVEGPATGLEDCISIPCSPALVPIFGGSLGLVL